MWQKDVNVKFPAPEPLLWIVEVGELREIGARRPFARRARARGSHAKRARAFVDIFTGICPFAAAAHIVFY